MVRGSFSMIQPVIAVSVVIVRARAYQSSVIVVLATSMEREESDLARPTRRLTKWQNYKRSWSGFTASVVVKRCLGSQPPLSRCGLCYWSTDVSWDKILQCDWTLQGPQRSCVWQFHLQQKWNSIWTWFPETLPMFIYSPFTPLLQGPEDSTDVCTASTGTGTSQLVPIHRAVRHHSEETATSRAIQRWTPGRTAIQPRSQAPSLVPRLPTSFPGPQPHSQAKLPSLIPRFPASFPGQAP